VGGAPQLAHAQAPADIKSALAASSLIEEIKKRGTLRVAYGAFKPWAMRSKTGDYIGFEIDVAKELAKDLGVTFEGFPTAWDGIIPALLAGRFDVIIGGMSVTVARNLTVNFSNGYNDTGVGMFANKKLAAGWTKVEDFNKADVTIVARRGTPAANSVTQVMPKATLRQFDEESPALQEVVNGRAHGMVGSIPLPAHSVRRYPNELFLPFSGPYRKEVSAFAVRKGDPDALNVFNNWIMLKRDLSSFLPDRNAYWFGGLDWEDQIQP